MHTQIVRGLGIRHAPIFNQPNRLKLELSCKLPPLHNSPPVPSKRLTRCLRNRVQASGKYEIGPRALGNRSILAAPFLETTRVRLNEIKQREQFRPVAPVCLEEEAARWFGCDHASPFMLYTQLVSTEALAA